MKREFHTTTIRKQLKIYQSSTRCISTCFSLVFVVFYCIEFENRSLFSAFDVAKYIQKQIQTLSNLIVFKNGQIIINGSDKRYQQ